jgi:hypothetical protein
VAEREQVADLIVGVVALLDHLLAHERRNVVHTSVGQPVEEVILVAALFLPHAVIDGGDVARRVVTVGEVDQRRVAGADLAPQADCHPDSAKQQEFLPQLVQLRQIDIHIWHFLPAHNLPVGGRCRAQQSG